MHLKDAFNTFNVYIFLISYLKHAIINDIKTKNYILYLKITKYNEKACATAPLHWSKAGRCHIFSTACMQHCVKMPLYSDMVLLRYILLQKYMNWQSSTSTHLTCTIQNSLTVINWPLFSDVSFNLLNWKSIASSPGWHTSALCWCMEIRQLAHNCKKVFK